MVGLNYNINIDDDMVIATVDRVITRGSNLAPAMDLIGAFLVSSVVDNFENQSDPIGVAWLPSKKKTGRTLIKKELLMNSITHIFGSGSVAVGSNVIYAAIHQLGGKTGRNLSVHMPARPYLGVGIKDRVEIKNILNDHLMAGG